MKNSHPISSYKTVQGLSRGLKLLNEMNRRNGGSTSTELADLTGIHRTTVKRLLETLRAEGYVRRSKSDDSYRLTLKVRELSEGFRDDNWISAIAAPFLVDLLQEVLWPTDFSTLDLDAMVVRETTHRFSRLSFHRSMVGRRLPLLRTASGLAYLAFCPKTEQQQLLELLANRDDEDGHIARDTVRVENLMLRTQRKGYGENFMGWSTEERIASIAVPIQAADNVLACLNIVYVAEAMSIAEAEKRYLPHLRHTADRIEQAISTQSRHRGGRG